ncbi:hyaluronan synthase [Conyzicola lurida]|uniref:Hyaluronan synthase n=1 Tax=Conyzicola lurida TaxID=1172621 RepID=A0A841AP08_9MICO|nr:glycosyltransferase family 2 protein [Conyzicola lurida]MBB5843285.1 hyaluronan synthase [Conyzicola lurida]
MFIFILQLRHLIEGHPELYLFTVYSACIWGLWIIKVLVSRRYRPFTGTFTGTTSVVVPVVDEPLDLFRDVIERMVEQKPGEIIVVINGAENPALQAVCEEYAPLVRWVHTPIPGKRNAVMIGTNMSTGDITVLVDSDTVWMPNALDELVKPFADSRVGGVTTRQRILEPERSWITRWADWLENSRSLYSMPAQSVMGQVGCLPGRTIAFRRSILMTVMDKFMTERFMGVFLEVSDDRTLTNLTLKEGYRTVYQHTSLVYTDAPLQVKKLFKQQLRWARGSQYNTLRMLPWMLGHAPLLALFFVMDIILPFLLAGVIGGWVYRAFTGEGINFYEGLLQEYGVQSGLFVIIALMVVSSVLSMGIRQMRHLGEKPSDFFRLPVFILASTFFLMPVRLIGFFRMGHASGWGTRAGAYAGGAQDDAADAAREHAVDEPGRLAAPGTADLGDIDAAWTLSGGTVTATTDGTQPLAVGSVLVDERRAEIIRPNVQKPVMRQTTPRRRLNPKAAFPYLIGFTIFFVEAVLLVQV